MDQHFLIAIATSKNPGLSELEQRPQLSDVLADVVSLFTQTLGGYRRELLDVSENASADELRKRLDSWFAAETRDPSDWVVVYYTGHAKVVGDSLFLLTSNFEPELYAGTAFNFDDLVPIVGAPRGFRKPRRVRNLLVIVDTCFAGAGTQDLASQFAKVIARTGGGSYYLLATAMPLQEADVGAFANALIGVIDELSKRHVTQEYFYFDQILPMINKRLRLHDAMLSAATAPKELPRFFPNPNYVRTDGRAVPADQAQRAITSLEFREHWGPRSRGVEFDSQPGAYFSGRDAVLAKLTKFFYSETDNSTRVITGRPGSGKSAILSFVVSRSRDGNSNVGRTAMPQIDLALHAKGKSLDDVKLRFADAFGVEAKTEAILECFRRSRSITRIVVDALDEAVQSSSIVEQLLAPMGGIPSVKLIVGTRAVHLALLGETEVIDIDRREFAEKADIAGYVEARLLRRDEPGESTPYSAKKSTATRVAAIVAERAYPNFLVARLIAEDLLTRSHAANPDSPKEMAFPTKVEAAFEAYLARFGAKENLVRDILRPLAYAEGQGLPWDNIWAPLASTLSDRSYTDDDVKWVLTEAGAFVLEGIDQGRSVYRLYHQALVDVMRKGLRIRSVNAAFTRALVKSVPLRSAQSVPDWLLANRYVLSHLATHAAKCYRLQKLISDPLYLLAADPTALLREVSKSVMAGSSELVAVYEEAIHHIRQEIPGIAASYLELVARQRSLRGFAEDTAALALPRPWNVPWARWVAQTPSRRLGQGASLIRALAVAVSAGNEALALVGRADGSAELWDIATGERLRHWLPAGVNNVWHIAHAQTRHGPLLVVSWHSGHLGALNLESNDSVVCSHGGGEEDPVLAMCTAERNGEPVCITAHRDLRLCVRQLPNLRPIVEVRTAQEIYGLRMVTPSAEGQPAVLSVGKSQFNDDGAGNEAIILWSLEDLSIIWTAGRGRGHQQAIEVSDFAGRKVAIVSNGSPTEIWTLGQPELLVEEPSSRHAWLHRFKGEQFIVKVARYELTARRLAIALTDDKLSVTAMEYRKPVPIVGDKFSSIVRVQNHSTILSADNDHIRAWTLDTLLSREQSDDSHGATVTGDAQIDRVLCLACEKTPSGLYVGGFGTVSALEVSTGVFRWQTNVGRQAVTGLATSPDAETIVGATTDGYILVLDGKRGTLRRTIKTGCKEIRRLAVSQRSERFLAFATAKDKDGKWSVRIWDLESAEEIATREAYQLTLGEEDKTLDGLALIDTSNALRFAFASRYSKVMVADFGGPVPTHYHRLYDEWYLPESAGEYVFALAAARCGEDVVLAAGTHEGDLVVWNFLTGELKQSRMSMHLGSVDAICFGNLDGKPVLISGSSDGILCVWPPNLEKRLFRVEIGEAITALTWMHPNRLAVASSRGVLTLQFNSVQ
jgi:WD40 repeat protein